MIVIGDRPVRNGGKIFVKFEGADAFEKDRLGSIGAIPGRKYRLLIVLLEAVLLLKKQDGSDLLEKLLGS